jgi:hypothetical protein
MLDWSEMWFARFAFDLVAMLQGTYDGRLSSFYGFGSSWGEIARRSKREDSCGAPTEPPNPGMQPTPAGES